MLHQISTAIGGSFNSNAASASAQCATGIAPIGEVSSLFVEIENLLTEAMGAQDRLHESIRPILDPCEIVDHENMPKPVDSVEPGRNLCPLSERLAGIRNSVLDMHRRSRQAAEAVRL